MLLQYDLVTSYPGTASRVDVDSNQIPAGSVRLMQTWMFGRRPYAHPALRWLVVPVFRIAFVLLVVPIAITGHSGWLGWVGIWLLVVSFIAALVNAALMRSRSRPSDSARP